ncbi:MAG: hypothetical protein QM490_06370 [Candidatus Gracilibacteria bacterium]
MNGFKKLSLVPGFSIDGKTGEMETIKMLETVSDVKERVNAYIQPSFTQNEIDQARNVTSPLGESVLCGLLGGKRVKKKNNRGYDLILPGGETMEAKIGRIGNSAVIKRNQLDYLDIGGFYGIVYYRTTNNLPPSHFIAQKTKLDPQAYLKRNIKIETVFIFPKSYIVYFYNTSKLKEGKISTTGVCHKALSYTNAKLLFGENIGEKEKYSGTMLYGKHQIVVNSVGYNIGD